VRFLNYDVMAVKEHRHYSFVAILALKVKVLRGKELGVVSLSGYR
jgi:hypothetical protein